MPITISFILNMSSEILFFTSDITIVSQITADCKRFLKIYEKIFFITLTHDGFAHNIHSVNEYDTTISKKKQYFSRF